MQLPSVARIVAAELLQEQEAEVQARWDEQLAEQMLLHGDSVNEDAQEYHKMLRRKTTFEVCGICGVEESSEHLHAKEETAIPSEYLLQLRDGYRTLIAVGGTYAAAVEQAFDEDGILRGCLWYCKRCVNAMERRRHPTTGTVHCDFFQTLFFLLYEHCIAMLQQS
jgi:hypothetical protein